MEQSAFAIFTGSHKSFELRLFADACLGQRFCCGAKGDGFQIQFHFPALAGFDLVRLMGELEIKRRDACRGGALCRNFCNAGSEHESVQGIWRSCLTSEKLGSCSVLLLRCFASFFALNLLHHGRRAGVGLLLEHGEMTQDGIVEFEGML